ncbi:hypothetical protein ACFCYB_10635 [Streptomyces sp. NPDC056309]|uniref:hypothetical protein n=1 Tax=unclassified Streptomyces TaxID=2593676 RepID=UPI0035DEA700
MAAMRASSAELEECRRLETVAEDGVEVEEVNGDDAFGLTGEELFSRRAGAAGGRVDAHRVADLPTANCRISFFGAALVGGRPVRARRSLSVSLRGHEPAVPGQQGPGRDWEDLVSAAAGHHTVNID